MGRPPTDKRQRLVSAAIGEFHKKGYVNTSLADVANAAGISTGNIFYYFKTKNDLALAVVDEWCSLLSGYLKALESEGDPWRRLEGFVEQAGVMRDLYVRLGCPLAGLIRDLRQQSDAFSSEVARIYEVQFCWLAQQFRLTGMAVTVSEDHSRCLMASYHGALLLAYAQDDPSLINGEVERLKSWLLRLRCTSDQNS